MGRRIAAGFKVAIPLNLEATDVARSPETPDRYPCAVWRDFRFFGTESKDLADHVTFPGQGREDVETQRDGRRYCGARGALCRAAAQGGNADGQDLSDCGHSRSRTGRVLVHRVLQQEGIESHVVDPASIAVPRRRRRAKTD